MNISLIDLHSVRFHPDSKTDELNDSFRTRLGMPHRYQPARLAIARSLAIDSVPPSVEKKSSKTIQADILFGAGEHLSTWIALITEHANDSTIDKSRLIELVASHWWRGIKLLDDEWKRSDQDLSKFVRRLVEVAEIPIGLPLDGGSQVSTGQTSAVSFSNSQITVPIGELTEDVTTKEKIKWNLNGAGGSPHSAIMGGVGTGKTRTAVSMLSSIREQAPNVPLIAFDFKGDLGGSASAYKLDQMFDARVISPPHEPVPLDVLALHSTEDFDITTASYRFREAFQNLKGKMGVRQNDTIYEATERALRAQTPCELQHIFDSLGNVYEEREFKEDGAVSTMRELCRLPLFKPEIDPTSFFQQSWLIKLPQNVPADSRKIVVNLVLNALDGYLNSLVDSDTTTDGARGLRVLCMVDEAHQILSGKLPALSNLIRLSRSKGGSIMLISQAPDDFSGEDDEFLNEMGLVAAFGSNASSSRHVKRIFGQNANLSALKTFQCFVKLRGDQTSKKIQSWPEVI